MTSTIWSGEYDEDYDYEARVVTKQRIDFAKYGKKREEEEGGKEETSTTNSLPPDIYCDLVNTLNQKWVNHKNKKYTKNPFCQVHIVHIFGRLALRRGFDPFCFATGNP